MSLIVTLKNLHDRFFTAVEMLTGNWLAGLLARLTFLAVLFFYYLNSVATKTGEGILGIFDIQDGAYFQILGEAGMLAYQFDTANVPWYLDLVVALGTYMEFLLPVLIVAGLFTRIAAIGMAFFVLVQSYVDITVHMADAGTIGALFDRHSDSLILDQRALWLFLLAYLALKGAGALSLDALASRWWAGRGRPGEAQIA
ncbi:MAG: DoxX family membrane protein [Nitratireductor sp.]|nr:DoxX family membrane protein [Nitratireductor sp.]